MIDPVLLVLPGLVLRMLRIVHGQRFGLGRRENAENAHGNGLGSHGRSPILAEETETDVTIGIHLESRKGELGKLKNHKMASVQETYVCRQTKSKR